MKSLKCFTFLVAMLLIASFAFGQATLTATTLSSAVTSTSAKYIVVASATGATTGNSAGVSVQTVLLVDNELMDIESVSSTTIQVVRGYGGTAAQQHASGANVYIGYPKYFVAAKPGGQCNPSQILALPQVVIPTGQVFDCLITAGTRATGTVVGLWTQIADGLNDTLIVGKACGTSTTCAKTTAANAFVAFGNCASSSATTCVVTSMPTATATVGGGCLVTDQTSVNNPAKAVWATNTLTITSSVSSSDTFSYVCFQQAP